MAIGTIFRLSKLMPLLWKYWWVFYFLLFVLPTAIQSIDMAREQGDYMIPILASGRAMASWDATLDDVVEDMEFEFDKGDDLDEQIDDWANFIWYILQNLWKPLFAMIFTFVLLFKVILKIGSGDTSKWRRAFLWTIFIMFILQILVAGVPFKGTINLAKFIIEVLRQL